MRASVRSGRSCSLPPTAWILASQTCTPQLSRQTNSLVGDVRSSRSHPASAPRRQFHDYFVTHLPSSSLHPDSRTQVASHKLPRDESTPHDQSGSSRSPASFQQSGRPNNAGPGRDMTVVRIPLKSAKHHYGASCLRGTRPYNEDTHQAGTIEIPAFAKRAPVSLTGSRRSMATEAQGADSASGDPQIFYFGVFDGHGGDKCSRFLRDQLHSYIETAAVKYGLGSTLRPKKEDAPTPGEDPSQLSQGIVKQWKETVGGYFRRFKPDYFAEEDGGKGDVLLASVIRSNRLEEDANAASNAPSPAPSDPTIEKVLTHAFLKADLDFVTAQTVDEDASDYDLDASRHSHHSDPPFLGGSTCSFVLISTPTPTPFWNPSSPLSVLTAHIGDTRILICDTATGAPVPLTADHHPSSPGEATRLRRYAAAFTTDSFGEERILGMANTRAFGDVRSKRIGVSAEPELNLLHLTPASHSFLVLVSDGVTVALSDQEIVDVVKEAKTPEQGARDVVNLATELAEGEKGQADNATAMVVRLGGWERRNEGGVGSLGTKEGRDWRKKEAMSGRGRRT